MTYSAKLTADGDLNIPSALRAELGFEEGERLVLERDGDGLVIKSYRQVIREIQTEFRCQIKGREFTVDDFIAERRAEAAREQAEFDDRR